MASFHITGSMIMRKSLVLVDDYLTPNSWCRPVTILENGEEMACNNRERLPSTFDGNERSQSLFWLLFSLKNCFFFIHSGHLSTRKSGIITLAKSLFWSTHG